MTEYGFWVYTGVGCGGCEGYGEREWSTLLDDMAEGGMNSIVICLNWLRMGFRSHLPYLQHDQDFNNPVIASDNEVLRYAIDAAHERNIKVWLQQSLNLYYLEGCDISLPPGVPPSNNYSHKFDLDTPQVKERSLERAVELIELFPQCDGISIEFEEHNKMYAHKIAPYNAWAQEHGMPSHEELMKRPANARGYQNTWVRHYTTWQVCQILQQLEVEAASRNWHGDMNFLCATGSGGGVYLLEADLERFAREAPNWSLVTYDYERWNAPLASAEYCMRYPKSLGIKTYFLPRGVMTWGHARAGWMPESFEEYWRRECEDALQHNLDGLWFFEADAFTDGPHADAAVLKQRGFESGVEARRALLKIAREYI